MEGNLPGRLNAALAQRSRPLSSYTTSYIPASTDTKCSTDASWGSRRCLRYLLWTVIGALIPISARAADCPKPNQREFESYAELASVTAAGAWEPPRLKKQTRPKYPDAAIKEKLAGIVVLSVLINENGCVIATRVKRSAPPFDEAAIECVVKWRFFPARRDGTPSATIAEIPVSFRFY